MTKHMLQWIVCGGAMAAMAAAAANEAPSVADQVKSIQQRTLAPKHRESLMKRKSTVTPAPRTASNGVSLHSYVDRQGVMTFTNRPEKYKGKRDYTAVDVTYKPIIVPKEYRPATVSRSPLHYTSQNVASLVTHYAKMYGLDENLVYALIKAESNFNANATSPAGACGLMQLMPGTAAEMGVTDIYDPAQNIAGGTQYLSKMLEIFDGDVRLALAGYNAGPNAVLEYNGIPPYRETQNYVERVLRFHGGFSGGAGVTMRTADLRGFRTVDTRAKRPVSKGGGSGFVVHFHSGLTQPADRVTDKDPYYYIEYGNLVYPVRKDLVKTIADS